MIARVLGDRLLVQLPAAPENLVSDAGIVLVKDPDRLHTPTRGIVVQLGEKTDMVSLDAVRNAIRDELWHEPSDYIDCHWADVDEVLNGLAPAPFDVLVGDCVLFPPSAGEEVEMDGIDYVILKESEIIGIVEPKKEAAA